MGTECVCVRPFYPEVEHGPFTVYISNGYDLGLSSSWYIRILLKLSPRPLLYAISFVAFLFHSGFHVKACFVMCAPVFLSGEKVGVEIRLNYFSSLKEHQEIGLVKLKGGEGSRELPVGGRLGKTLKNSGNVQLNQFKSVYFQKWRPHVPPRH